MSSTEQKNVTQPFVNCSHTFGILPSLLVDGLTNYELDTNSPPFVGLQATGSLSERLKGAEDPIADSINLIPILRNSPMVGRMAPALLRLASDSRVYAGNQAVLRLCEGIVTDRWGFHFLDTASLTAADKHAARVCAYLAPGSYGQLSRTGANIHRIKHSGSAKRCRIAADVIDHISSSPRNYTHDRRLRYWCATTRLHTGFANTYRSQAQAIADYKAFNPNAIHAASEPPELNQKWISKRRLGHYEIKIYNCGSLYLFKIKSKFAKITESTLSAGVPKARFQKPIAKQRGLHELYILSYRDLQDLSFLLQATSQIKLYHRRRLMDARTRHHRLVIENVQNTMWSLYLQVMWNCADNFDVRNKLGVYFDVLQWRYLAWRSGDVFYDHSYIMEQKIHSKGLVTLPSQEHALSVLKACPMDVAVDMLGIYKASIYPEVDPYRVVADQYKLHMSRHNTDWPVGSPEYYRFQDTRAYMWYLGIRVLKGKFGFWPGEIRDGAEPKSWHKTYKQQGIPGDDWRDGHDVDLTGVLPVMEITNEQYMKQQDSACAPPLWEEYKSFEALRKAPRRHRRKLLYAIQEEHLVDLPGVLRELNSIGEDLPDGYTGKIDYRPNFSTDIVTGSRCERHKDTPRPFYAASPPWGCILSYFDGITRDFLNYVPQSMLGKSTRQKFMDISTLAATQMYEGHTFFMSDDKAKYSPKMDPHSQQLPADFFAEVFNIPGIRAFGPVMYHCELYYRVNGHLVHYNSNGTDREGMRGASNTWVEIVAQGLTTRLSREKKLITGKSVFLSFIDDGLRKFALNCKSLDPIDIENVARLVIQDVIFGLRVLGRELSWDKTFISKKLFVILNELMYDGSFISSGLKSFCTAGDVELKEVMTAPDYEQLYFGKMRGAHGVGAPIDICHYTYVYETIASHIRMGLRLQDNGSINKIDYRLFCITPVALGGAGIRSPLQMSCTEVASATKEGIGNLSRLAGEFPIIGPCVRSILNQPFEQLSPIDFIREPEQFHVMNPRLKTQRLAAEVRRQLANVANNEMSKRYIEQDQKGLRILEAFGRVMMSGSAISAEDVRLQYAILPVAFVDEFVQKLASSVTLAELLPRQKIVSMRRLARIDLVTTANYFSVRCGSRSLMEFVANNMDRVALIGELIQ